MKRMNPNSTNDPFIAAFVNMQAEQRRKERARLLKDWGASYEDPVVNARFQELLNNLRGATRPVQEAPPKWNTIQEMMAYMKAHPPTGKTKPAVPKKDPEYRRREIEYELDIIRGRVPTPPGYQVDTSKVKDLMAELKQLTS